MDTERLAVARSTRGFMPDDEGLALYRAGLAAAGEVGGPLVEIGTYCAKSAVYLGSAADEAGTTLFSIDHHRGSEELQPGCDHHDPAVVDRRSGRMDTLPFARDTLARAGLEATVVLVVGSSATVAAQWSTPAALVFIDGGHADALSWDDYHRWSPVVAPGGLLAIHDVFPDPVGGGRPPYEVYLEALASGRFVERPELGCGSLRVLWRPATSR